MFLVLPHILLVRNSEHPCVKRATWTSDKLEDVPIRNLSREYIPVMAAGDYALIDCLDAVKKYDLKSGSELSSGEINNYRIIFPGLIYDCDRNEFLSSSGDKVKYNLKSYDFEVIDNKLYNYLTTIIHPTYDASVTYIAKNLYIKIKYNAQRRIMDVYDYSFCGQYMIIYVPDDEDCCSLILDMKTNELNYLDCDPIYHICGSLYITRKLLPDQYISLLITDSGEPHFQELMKLDDEYHVKTIDGESNREYLKACLCDISPIIPSGVCGIVVDYCSAIDWDVKKILESISPKDTQR